MANYRVSIDYSALLNGLDQINAEIAGRVREAVGVAAGQVHAKWADGVMKAPGVWHEQRRAYVQSLTWQYTGPFSAEVRTDYKEAEAIETGRPARDLKRMLDTSLKVRESAQGRRYLIIPFRHNIPGGDGHSSLAPQMPESVYLSARRLAASLITGQGLRLSGTGAWDPRTRAPATVRQNRYAWGERLDASEVSGLSAQQQRRYQGMYRFDTSAGKARSSQYLTFRVMAEGSPGWIVPAKPGLYIARGVAQSVQLELTQAMQSRLGV